MAPFPPLLPQQLLLLFTVNMGAAGVYGKRETGAKGEKSSAFSGPG